MSNAKLPAPNDRCKKCGNAFDEHLSRFNYNQVFEPLQVEGPTSNHTHAFTTYADGTEISCIVCGLSQEEWRRQKAGAEATGKSDELTMNKFVDKYLTYAYSRQHTGDMWTLTLEKVWKEVIEPLLSNKKA